MAHRSPFRILCTMLALLWALGIFWLSSAPDARGAAQLLTFPGADKLAHAAVFGVLAALLYGATGRPYLAVLLASAYGIFDEVHQAFVPGRHSDPLDWVANTVGAYLTVMAVRYLTHRRRLRLNPVE